MRGWIGLILVGCGAGPIELPAGAHDYGLAAFAANPHAVDGLYVPALAGCTVSEEGLDEPAEDVVYDQDGRLVRGPVLFALLNRPMGQDPSWWGGSIDISWDGPCPTEWWATDELGETLVCDDHGWPVEATRTYKGEFELGFRWDRTYEGDRLVEVDEYQFWAETDPPLFVAHQTVEWDAKGRPVSRTRQEAVVNGARTNTTATWSWGGGRLNRLSVLRSHLGSNGNEVEVDQTRFVYDARGRLTEAYGNPTWHYRYANERDRWPNTRWRGKEAPTTVQTYDCP